MMPISGTEVKTASKTASEHRQTAGTALHIDSVTARTDSNSQQTAGQRQGKAWQQPRSELGGCEAWLRGRSRKAPHLMAFGSEDWLEKKFGRWVPYCHEGVRPTRSGDRAYVTPRNLRVKIFAIGIFPTFAPQFFPYRNFS